MRSAIATWREAQRFGVGAAGAGRFRACTREEFFAGGRLWRRGRGGFGLREDDLGRHPRQPFPARQSDGTQMRLRLERERPDERLRELLWPLRVQRREEDREED
jgi:hypothetical protein